MRKTSERGLAFLILVASACIGTYSYANHAASTKVQSQFGQVKMYECVMLE